MRNVEQVYVESYHNKLTATDYYLIASKQVEEDIFISFFSGWEPGDNSEFIRLLKENKEYRSLCLVDPEKVVEDFLLFDQKVSIVNDREELFCANNIGGAALISATVVQKHWSEILKPVLTLSTDRGFIDYASIGGKYLQRFARDEYRMTIFNRDGCQCRICGASPDDSVRVRLEVHHIKPWEEGGISIPENLITLCDLCHAGVDKLDRNILYKKVGSRSPVNNCEILSLPKNCTRDQLRKHYYLQSNLVTVKVRKNKRNRELFSGL